MVAEDRYSARDALELIDVEYEPLPAVVDARRALDPGAPVIRDDLPGRTGNHIFDWEAGDAGRTEAVFARRRGDDHPGHALPAGPPGAAGDLRRGGGLRPGQRQADHLGDHPGPARAPDPVRHGGRPARAQDPGDLAGHRRRVRQQGADLSRLRVRGGRLDRHRAAGQVDGGPVGEPDVDLLRPGLPHARGAGRRPGRPDPGGARHRPGRSRRVQRDGAADQVPGRLLRRVHRLVRPGGRALPGDRRVHQQGTGRGGVLVLVPRHRGGVPDRAAGRPAGLRAGRGPGRAADAQPAASRAVPVHLPDRLDLRLRRLPPDAPRWPWKLPGTTSSGRSKWPNGPTVTSWALV